MELLFASPLALGLAIAFLILFASVAFVSWQRRKKHGKTPPPPPVVGVAPPVKFEMPTVSMDSNELKEGEIPRRTEAIPISQPQSQPQVTQPETQPGQAGEQLSKRTLPHRQEAQKVRQNAVQEQKPQPQKFNQQAMESSSVVSQQVPPLAVNQSARQKEMPQKPSVSESSSPSASVSGKNGTSKKRLLILFIPIIVIFVGLAAVMVLIGQRQEVQKEAQVVLEPTPVIPISPSLTKMSVVEVIPTVEQSENIRFYDLEWNQLSDDDLLNYTVGDFIRIGVVAPDKPTVTKARIRIKQGDVFSEWSEIEKLKPEPKAGEREFYLEYQLPPGPTNFTVETEIFDDGVWK